jgi:hypothetical protein
MATMLCKHSRPLSRLLARSASLQVHMAHRYMMSNACALSCRVPLYTSCYMFGLQAAQRAAADIASHQLSDGGLESDSDADIPSADESASEDSDAYSEGESEATGTDKSPTAAMIQRARHGTAKQAADRHLARTAAQFGADAEGNGSDSDGSSAATPNSAGRQAVKSHLHSLSWRNTPTHSLPGACLCTLCLLLGAGLVVSADCTCV